jgi:hypothetical protein
VSLEVALEHLQNCAATLRANRRLRRLLWDEAHHNRKRSDTWAGSYAGRWIAEAGLKAVEHPEICCLLKEQENPPEPSPPSHWFYQI